MWIDFILKIQNQVKARSKLWALDGGITPSPQLCFELLFHCACVHAHMLVPEGGAREGHWTPWGWSYRGSRASWWPILLKGKCSLTGLSPKSLVLNDQEHCAENTVHFLRGWTGSEITAVLLHSGGVCCAHHKPGSFAPCQGLNGDCVHITK